MFSLLLAAFSVVLPATGVHPNATAAGGEGGQCGGSGRTLLVIGGGEGQCGGAGRTDVALGGSGIGCGGGGTRSFYAGANARAAVDLGEGSTCGGGRDSQAASGMGNA